ncbi:MAG: class I mannose-6-phosphate isomerase [Candidatus Bipolaricaulota bacterium]
MIEVRDDRKNEVDSAGIGENLISGKESLAGKLRDIIANSAGSTIIGFDGFPKVNWDIVSRVREKLTRDFDVELLDGFSVYRSPEEIWPEIRPCLTSDEYFGRIYEGSLDEFISPGDLEAFEDEIKRASGENDAVICFGAGISYRNSTRKLFDELFYLDIGKRTALERMNEELPWFVPSDANFGEKVADVGLSLQSFKLSQYVFPPVFEDHRKKLLGNGWLDYYVDTNLPGEPKTVSGKTLSEIASRLAETLISFDPVHVPSPWGGQWFKEREGLDDDDYPNCAWKFEVILPEMNLKLDIDGENLVIPGNTLLGLKGSKITGSGFAEESGHRFPIRVHYDDNWDGDNMAIQVHPDRRYAGEQFNEPIGQHEAYYIVESQPNSRVYLGLKDETSPEELYRDAKRAEEKGAPLNYEDYLESFNSEPGDLFLLPAGTIHALGKGNVCLEVGIGWGYTFHVYDYFRPDLRGDLRPIHLDHAFSVLDETRTTEKVKRNLREDPRTVDEGLDWVELRLGKHPQIPWEVRRLEFGGKVSCRTKEKFHILAVTNGKSVKLEAGGKSRDLGYTNSVLIPASAGEYRLENQGDGNVEVLKLIPVAEQ